MRAIIVFTFVFVFLICSIPIMIVEWIIGKFNMELKSKSSLAIVNWAFRVVIAICNTKVTVIGEENVPKDEPVLYIGNHRSFFDIVLTYVRVPRLTGYIAKKEIRKVPLLSHWMVNLHCLFLDRDNIKEGLKTILAAIEKVKSGISICIFPEGTRNRGDEPLLPFHDGSFKIADKSGCAIIPITLNNTSAIFEDHLPWIRKAHIIIEYGKPIYPNNLDKIERKQLSSMVQSVITDTYLKNQSLLDK